MKLLSRSYQSLAMLFIEQVNLFIKTSIDCSEVYPYKLRILSLTGEYLLLAMDLIINNFFTFVTNLYCKKRMVSPRSICSL